MYLCSIWKDRICPALHQNTLSKTENKSLDHCQKEVLKSKFSKYRWVGGHDDLDLQLSHNSYYPIKRSETIFPRESMNGEHITVSNENAMRIPDAY